MDRFISSKKINLNKLSFSLTVNFFFFFFDTSLQTREHRWRNLSVSLAHFLGDLLNEILSLYVYKLDEILPASQLLASWEKKQNWIDHPMPSATRKHFLFLSRIILHSYLFSYFNSQKEREKLSKTLSL